MADDLLKGIEEQMRGTVEALRKELVTLRTGRASPSLLERVYVNYYGVQTPLNQVAGVTAPEARMLLIQPWDKSMLPEIEKAILKSDLGLTPNSDGNIIRLIIPQLTKERRNELVKATRKKAEEYRVAVRNIRRDANDISKKLEKEGLLTEDESRRLQEQNQKLTDRYIELIDKILAGKEQEILEV